jgi:EAL domain-containing protein (putative c-di-GMP-specific phosphodiesterase class I)
VALIDRPASGDNGDVSDRLQRPSTAFGVGPSAKEHGDAFSNGESLRWPMAVLVTVLIGILVHSLFSRRPARQIEGWLTLATLALLLGIMLDTWGTTNHYRAVGSMLCLSALTVGWVTAGLPSQALISPVAVRRDLVIGWSATALLLPATLGVARFVSARSWVESAFAALAVAALMLTVAMVLQTRWLSAVNQEHRQQHNELMGALSTGQLDVYYQQIVNVDSALCGAEALVRWHHPTRGLLTAAAFLPADSDCDASIAASRWVIKRVLDDIATDRHRLAGRFVTINVPPALFVDPWLMATMRSWAETRTGETHVVLELIETSVVQEWSALRDIVSELRALGIDVALDDFGDGYAHLRAIRDTGALFVKLDRSIVEGLSSEPGTIVLRAAIDMAHSLGCQVIAEGVEERDTAEWLTRHGVEMQQGYLHGKPGPWFGAARVSTQLAAA